MRRSPVQPAEHEPVEQAVTFSSRPLAVYAARYLQQLEYMVAGRSSAAGGAEGELEGDERWKATLKAARLCQVPPNKPHETCWGLVITSLCHLRRSM